MSIVDNDEHKDVIMNLIRYIKDWANNNPGRAIGAISGFVIAVMILFLGIINVFLMLFLVGVGYVIGRAKDKNISIVSKLADIYYGIKRNFKR